MREEYSSCIYLNDKKMIKRILGRLTLILVCGWFLFFKVKNLSFPVLYIVLLIVTILMALRWVIFFFISCEKYDSITTNSMNFFVSHYSRRLKFKGDETLIFNDLVKITDVMNLTIQEQNVKEGKISCIKEDSLFHPKSKISITFHRDGVETLILFESITGSLFGLNSQKQGKYIVLEIKDNLDTIINSQVSDEVRSLR